MLQQLVQALVESDNEAADDVLLEALDVGNEREKTVALSALIKRGTVRGLSGVIGMYPRLPEALQRQVLAEIKSFHPALRECGRSDDPNRRVMAMKLIARGRQGRMSFVLSENLNQADDALSRPAVEALVDLASWVATETRQLSTADDPQRPAVYAQLIEQRAEIEAAVVRALDVHRGRHGADLLRAALLLCDSASSRILSILRIAKHGGQSPMVRRLQQPPDSEHVAAFLLGASHGGLRTHFGIAFSHIDQAPVLDAILLQTHRLKDHQLQLCMHQVTRGPWWTEMDLGRDLDRRAPADAARIGEWLAVSGLHDVLQDERLIRLWQHARKEPKAPADDEGLAARLRVLRIALRRPRNASVALLRAVLDDADERLVRIAARDLVRRKPADLEVMLLRLMTGAAESVRRIISRSLGQAGFDNYWERFDRLNPATRRAAGRAMVKMLPDTPQRLARKLTGGPVEQRLKALHMAQELGLAEALRPVLVQLCGDSHARIRSRAVSLLGDLPEVPSDVLLDRVLTDADARVRANAIEVLESHQRTDYLSLLAQRARSGNNRERANAIKALHRMKVGHFSQQLFLMLKDERPEHRISAMWVLKHVGWWQLLPEIGRLAKDDSNLRVRRYALSILHAAAGLMKEQAVG